MRSCELCVFQYESMASLAELETIPTVCLFAFHERLDIEHLAEIVKYCLSVGAILFASYGDFSDEVEEEIDSLLEEGGTDCLDVMTTSHKDESIEETINFLLNAAYCDDESFRCLIIYDIRTPNNELLLQEVNKLCCA